MGKMLCFVALLAASSFTQGAEDFTPLEKEAWRLYCKSELYGDTAYCSCVHTLQVRDVGVNNVKINYLLMAEDLPDLTDAQVGEAADGIISIVGDNESKIEKAIEVYEKKIETNMKTCDS